MNAKLQTSLVAVALAIALADPATASCTLKSFGKSRSDLCERADCLASAPPEIRKIKRGVASEFIGLAINDGVSRWLATDLDKSRLIVVEIFGGKHLDEASKTLDSMKPSKAKYGRRRNIGSATVVEFIRISSLPASAVGHMICEANGLWSETTGSIFVPPVQVTDSFNKLYLIDNGVFKEFGGPGDLGGAARQLRDRLTEMIIFHPK